MGCEHEREPDNRGEAGQQEQLVLAGDPIRLAARAEVHRHLVGREEYRHRGDDEVERHEGVDDAVHRFHRFCSFRLAIHSSVSSSTEAFNS